MAIALRSVNFTDRYIRHRHFLIELTRINRDNELDRKDATFNMIEGLVGGPDHVSFEPVNFPEFFLETRRL